MRIGSLFSGAGGLDLAVEHAFDGHTEWHCEYDGAASKVLATHWPGVPNHHDVTTVDWDTVAPVDVLCGGYPCQPFSAAGQRKGTTDERHLWPYFAEAIRRIRPRFVVLENVAGHRSMGFDRVLGDLAEMRFDAEWCSLRASDVGAAHGRERLFVLAYPAGDRRHEGRPEPTRLIGRPHAAQRGSGPVELLPTPCAKHSGNTPENHLRKKPGRKVVTDLAILVENGLIATGGLLQTPSAADGAGSRKARGGARGNEPLLPGQAVQMATEWGKYERAVRRWEAVVGPAPSPTQPNRAGNPRLNPAFSEWLMGWPAGWATDVPGISRNDQLRIIGNGVVPQCALVAIRSMLALVEENAA